MKNSFQRVEQVKSQLKETFLVRCDSFGQQYIMRSLEDTLVCFKLL